MIGQTISHYRILEKVGEGGMGIVYKAEDTKLHREVALKFLAPQALGTEEERARFRHEAQAAAALDHPSVCPIYEIDEHEGQLFIAMALIEGQDLSERIAAGPLRIDDALRLAIQIADGLQAAHAKQIVHRDIKPGNIMITTDRRARIMDFGLAKSSAATRVTRAGTTTGTIAYMSPEQTQGQEVDQRTDVWSFGAMLYEMVTGQRPFRGDYEQAVIHSILSEEPEPMTGLRTGVPLELERIAHKAMAKRPDERYQAMGEMLADLRTLQRRLDSGAEVPTTTLQSGPSRLSGIGAPGQLRDAHVERGRSKALAIGLIAVAAVIVVVAALVFGPQLIGRSGPRLDPATVVVAVFENRTGDASFDPVGQMVADGIAEGLARTDLVSVLPTLTLLDAIGATAGSASGSVDAARLRAACERTGAGTLVSGAYYLQGDSLQFRARITDVVSGELIRALPAASGPAAAPMSAITAMSQKMMGAFAAHLGRARLIRSSHIPSFEAYQELAAGMERFGRDYEAAIQHFERAIELDSLYLHPRIFAIYSYSNLGHYAQVESLLRELQVERQHLGENGRLFVDQMEASLQRDHATALRLLRELEQRDPTSPAANYLVGLTALRLNRPQETIDAYGRRPRSHGTGGGARFDLTWWAFSVYAAAHHLLGDYEDELEILRRGQELFPDVISLRADEMRALAALGHVGEALALVDDCIAMSRDHWSAGDVLIFAAEYLRAYGHLETSLDLARRAVEWHGSLPPAEMSRASTQEDLADAFYLAERWSEAQPIYSQLAAADPDNVHYQDCLGCLAARMGNAEEARQIIARLQELRRPYLYGDHLYSCACIASLLGEREQAVTLLREAIAQGYSDYESLHCDMDLEPLRDYPPFQELLRPKG